MLCPVTFSRAFVLPCQCSVYAAKRFRTDQSAYCRMRGTLESCSQWKEYSRNNLFVQVFSHHTVRTQHQYRCEHPRNWKRNEKTLIRVHGSEYGENPNDAEQTDARYGEHRRQR